MRVKTDSRRQAILDIATELFREMGYARASMAIIAARVGGSKATLYNYFRSKEELYAAAMIEAMEEQAKEAMDLLDPLQKDVRSVLLKFGRAYIRLVTAPDALAITRTAVAESLNTRLGPELYARGPRRGWTTVATYLEHLRARGDLREVDVNIAAAQLKGLLEAGIVEPLLFGARPEFEEKAAAEAAVDSFMRAYARPPETEG